MRARFWYSRHAVISYFSLLSIQEPAPADEWSGAVAARAVVAEGGCHVGARLDPEGERDP